MFASIRLDAVDFYSRGGLCRWLFSGREENGMFSRFRGILYPLDLNSSMRLMGNFVTVVQALETEAAKEVARKERERLKLQEQQRKQQVEEMRMQMNKDASAGDVRSMLLLFETLMSQCL